MEFGLISLRDGRGYLIPLSSRQVAVSALHLYNAQSVRARLAKKALSLGLWLGIAQPFVQRVCLEEMEPSIVSHGNDTIFQYIQRVLQHDDLRFALSLGTPGPHRKPVVQVMTNEGDILAYAKVGWNQITNSLVQREAFLLRGFADRPPVSFRVPYVLHSGYWRNNFVCVQSSSRSAWKTTPRILTDKHFNVLKELASFNSSVTQLRDSRFWLSLSQRKQEVSNDFYRDTLERGMDVAGEWLSDIPVLFHLRHGDFAPWNMKWSEQKPFIFDWEYASEMSPILWDLFHFLFQTMWLIKDWGANRIYSTVIRSRAVRVPVESFITSLGYESRQIEAFFLLYVLERLSLEACSGDRGDFNLPCALSLLSRLLILNGDMKMGV